MEGNIFEGRTEDEAVNEGLMQLCVLRDEVEWEVVESTKKTLFREGKVVIKMFPKRGDGERAVKFIDGLFGVMEIDGNAEIIKDGDDILIEIKTPSSARVIGKRGDVLDAIQVLTSAVANIGRDEYKKVVVDCEEYRGQREETLKNLANKIAAKAVETGRKVILEPMSSYERRVIHAALADNTDVKTLSEGNEPARYIVVIPNGADPDDRGIRLGERRHDNRHGGDRGRRDARGGDRRGNNRDRRGNERGARGGDRRPHGDGDRSRPSGGLKKAKREIRFGTFLGNSGAGQGDENKE